MSEARSIRQLAQYTVYTQAEKSNAKTTGHKIIRHIIFMLTGRCWLWSVRITVVKLNVIA